ncbi:MAG: CopD family protein [Thermoplasmataceae archaeon]|jgi:putative copper resistance protein D
MGSLIFTLILWIHLFFAIIFIGGSYFIWFVIWPESFKLTKDEKERTKIVGIFSKRFAVFTNYSVLILIITGIALALHMYFQNTNLFDTLEGLVLEIKVAVVGLALGIMYYNNLTHPKKIVSLLAKGKRDEVEKIRKRAHIFSYATLVLLGLITVLGTFLVNYF